MPDTYFWDQKYKLQDTGWDIGNISTPLKAYIDNIDDKNLRILIPGCGNAYEAKYLLDKGFKHITLIDISPTLVNKLRLLFSGVNEINIIQGDFFKHDGQYNLILEQTFFCAIDPKLRADYFHRMYSLLYHGGKLVGVLFNRNFDTEGPPFGGTADEYINYINDGFIIKKMEPCYNSITPRAGNELFFILEKPY